jgi:hypothetical protein
MTFRLSQEEVRTKYGPTPNALWTPEIDAAFVATLPHKTHPDFIKLSRQKEMLIRQFAKESLKAQRMGVGYVETLGAILGKFAEADNNRGECLISQRTEQLGTANQIRTIQAQLLSAGILVTKTRSQGKGFVGSVFVYSPKQAYQYRKATAACLEKAYRNHEGESHDHQLPMNLKLEDALF